MQTDALPSNSGDRYHFVYAARRMLDMLHPRNDLTLIEMENVAKEDLKLAKDVETFLGVDLTEYYGGPSSDTASLIIAVQVKYSPTHRNERWTLERLCANKSTSAGKTKPGSSVLRKLANVFDAFYAKLGGATRGKFQIKLHTNQQLDRDLEIHISEAKRIIAGRVDQAAGNALSRTAGDLRKTLGKLKDTTALPWKRLAAFLDCWDITAFGKAMLSDAEAELFTAATQYRSDSDLYIDRLIAFVQDHASANRPTEVTREKVYAQLRLREADFFPAPARFAPIKGLILTEAAKQVISKIESIGGGILLVHGVSGTGKSTTLQLVAKEYGNGKVAIIYDSYAGGAGLQLGSERFPYERCFVQVINELDSLLRTNILATTSLNQSHLIARFNKALEKAAEIAGRQGHRLVVGFDAVDDAVTAAERSPLKEAQSFVPLLWKLRCPENCVIVVMSRTENLPRLNIDCPYHEMQIGGFSEAETAEYVRHFRPDAEEGLVRHIHKRTKGNPRVQSKLVEAVKHEMVTDVFSFVNDKAKETAFQYYEEVCPERIKSVADKLVLGVLLEAALPIEIRLLADILNRPTDEVRVLIESLYFGLRIDSDGRVSWSDRDFFDFSRGYAADSITSARTLLAEYCERSYETSAYAKNHLSRHFFFARWFAPLIEWWLKEDRLINRIAEASPHEEDILADVQYAVRAAIRIKQFADSLRLLAIAADIKQGRDLFSREIKNHTGAAIECNYLERLLDSLREDGDDLPQCYFRIARSLAERGQRLDMVEDLVRRGSAIIYQERTLNPDRARGFYREDVLNIGIADVFSKGLRHALERMQDWDPQETVYPVYGSLAQACAKNPKEDILAAIASMDLNPSQRAYSLLGVVSARSVAISNETLQPVLEEINGYFAEGLLEGEAAQEFIPDLVINLLRRGLTEEAKAVLPRWKVCKPISERHPRTFTFCKVKALNTALGVEEFDPKGFELDRPPGSAKSLEDGQAHLQRTIRDEINRIYPGTLAWVRSLVAAPPQETLSAIEDVIRRWTSNVERWWYEPQFSFINIAALLLEAVTRLPGYHGDAVDSILQAVEQVLADATYRGYDRYADVLSLDSRYCAQAEKLIQDRRGEIRPPAYRASDAVQALLGLYPIADRIDRELAFDVFTDARLAATEWDGNIGGRAFALLRTAYRAHDGVAIDDERVSKMAAVFEYMKQVAFEDTNTRLEEVLRLIARIRPSFALEVLDKLDSGGIFDIDDGIGPVGLGMKDAGHVPAQAVWPLTYLIVLSEKVEEVFYDVIPDLLAGNAPVDPAMGCFARHLRTQVRRELRAGEAREFLNWAEQQGLEDHAVMKGMRDFATELDAIGVSEREDVYTQATASEDQRSPLFKEFLDKWQESPLAALSVLTQAETPALRALWEPEVDDFVDRLTSSIASAHIDDLYHFVEKWSEDHMVPRITGIVIRIAERMASRVGSSNKLTNALMASLRLVLTPGVVRQLSREYYRNYLEAILGCRLLPLETRIETVLSAISAALKELSAEEVYWMVGHLGELLPAAEAFNVFDTLLARAVTKLPEGAAHKPVTAEEPLTSLIHFISNLLGHPRQATRWRALYTLVDIALNVPESALGLLIDELQDDNHERWMTKREWLLLALHHVSLHAPSLLVPFQDAFVRQALNTDFPHAKIRHQSREIILNIEKGDPGAIATDTLERIRAVNTPKKFIESPRPGTRRVLSKGATNEDFGEGSREGLFTFDSTDTIPYWYNPLAECFAAHTREVTRIAYKWIVERWGITRDVCSEEQRRRKYRYPETSHRHGSEPATETLRVYAERHGMFMAAGELVDSKPVVHDGQREGDRWLHWTRRRLRGADPALTGRLIDAPPAIADNYGVFPSDFGQWHKKAVEDEFRREVSPPNQPDWLVVGSYSNGLFYDRSFSMSVESALISRQTGSSLARLINSLNDPINLPSVDAYYNTILPEFEHDLNALGDYYITTDHEIDTCNGLFQLKAWLANWHQEMPFHSFDPQWPQHGRGFDMPGPDFMSRLGLKRDPISLEWVDAQGQCVAYHEQWYDYEGNQEYSAGSDGHRLVVRRDALIRYLQSVGLDMIFLVELNRHRSYRHRHYSPDEEEESEYDASKSVAYLLTGDGELQ